MARENLKTKHSKSGPYSPPDHGSPLQTNAENQRLALLQVLLTQPSLASLSSCLECPRSEEGPRHAKRKATLRLNKIENGQGRSRSMLSWSVVPVLPPRNPRHINHGLHTRVVRVNRLKKLFEVLDGSNILFLIANIATTSKALVTSSDALVPSS